MNLRVILALTLAPASLWGCSSTQDGLPDWVRAEPTVDSESSRRSSEGTVSLTRRELDSLLRHVRGTQRPQTVARRRPGRSNVMIFDVHDLLRAQPDFVAPEINVLTSDADYEPGSVRMGEAFMDEDALLNLIRDTIKPGTWDEDGNSIHISNGKIFVTRKETKEDAGPPQ